MEYRVVRTDRMAGTNNDSYLRSGIYYDNNDELAEIENGTLVSIDELLDGEREVYKLSLADTNSEGLIGVVANRELHYDERKHLLNEYINKPGQIVRIYVLARADMFSIIDSEYTQGDIFALFRAGDVVDFNNIKLKLKIAQEGEWKVCTVV